MIKNLVFDFGKVLVDYDFDHVTRTFFDNEEDFRQFDDYICSPEFVALCDLEPEPMPVLVERMKREQPQFALQWQFFYDRYIDFVTGEVPGMRDMLRRLKAEGFHVYGLSNWCSLVYPVMEKYPIFRELEGCVISSELHCVKPDPAIYQELFRRFDLRPEECVFTDDKEANVLGAEKVGMRAILFENPVQFEHELRLVLASF